MRIEMYTFISVFHAVLLRTVISQEFVAVRILDMRAAIWRESWEAHLLIPGSKMEPFNIRMSSKVATEKPSTKKMFRNSESAKMPLDQDLGRAKVVIN